MYIKIGKRIIFDKQTGKVLNGTLEQMEGDLQEGLRPLGIDFIDLPFGSTALQDVDTYHVDITKDKITTQVEQMIIIDSKLQHTITYEELQQQLLQSQGVI